MILQRNKWATLNTVTTSHLTYWIIIFCIQVTRFWTHLVLPYSLKGGNRSLWNTGTCLWNYIIWHPWRFSYHHLQRYSCPSPSHKVHRRSRGTAPLVLNLGTRWRRVVIFKHCCFINALRTTSTLWLAGHQTLDCPVHSLGTINLSSMLNLLPT